MPSCILINFFSLSLRDCLYSSISNVPVYDLLEYFLERMTPGKPYSQMAWPFYIISCVLRKQFSMRISYCESHS